MVISNRGVQPGILATLDGCNERRYCCAEAKQNEREGTKVNKKFLRIDGRMATWVAVEVLSEQVWA